MLLEALTRIQQDLCLLSLSGLSQRNWAQHMAYMLYIIAIELRFWRANLMNSLINHFVSCFIYIIKVDSVSDWSETTEINPSLCESWIRFWWPEIDIVVQVHTWLQNWRYAVSELSCSIWSAVYEGWSLQRLQYSYVILHKCFVIFLLRVKCMFTNSAYLILFHIVFVARTGGLWKSTSEIVYSVKCLYIFF